MSVRRMLEAAATVAALLVLARLAWGQSSSLYRRAERQQSSMRVLDGRYRPKPMGTNAALEAASLISVRLPEPRRFRLHDLITIIVLEKKKYESDAETDLQKKIALQAKLEKWFRIHKRKWFQQDFEAGTPQVDFSLKGQWEGEGTAEREDRFTMRITAEVVDVKPNGNLVLEARKYIKNDEDEQIITLTGVCRGADVTADNTVLSTQVAGLTIRVTHVGAVRDATRRGWIPRLFDLLRPF